jgi:hypothetical protein
MERPPTAAETRAWVVEHGLTDAVRRVAAQLPPELPAKAVELLRAARRSRRAEAARRGMMPDAARSA